MTASPQGHTALKIMDACEEILREVDSFEDATLRRIAERANTTASAVGYHFGSQERLVLAVGRRAYQRLNAERLNLLNEAVRKRAPGPADLGDIIAALIGPSVRWSLDPGSSYRILVHFTQSAERSREPDLYQDVIEGVEHHRVFIQVLHRQAPWFDEAQIGWRVSCALGIRSQIIRHRSRTDTLTNHTIDFADADAVIARMVEVIVPMFRHPG